MFDRDDQPFRFTPRKAAGIAVKVRFFLRRLESDELRDRRL